MSPPPRVTYIPRAQRARIHTPGRVLPIIVVPDLMGTRLTDPETGKLVWNPKGTPMGDDPGGYVANVERLAQMSVELIPDETHPYDRISTNRALIQSKVKHGRSMLVNPYGLLCVALKEGGSTTPHNRYGVDRALYFCGYDWRQDNARSALRLSEMVDEALAETGATKVVLIGHGMGGQICRYYCRALGGESKVHQLFLMGTPILGAPSAFAALKHGLEGLYPREIIDAVRTGRTGALVFECIQQTVDVLLAAGGHGAGASIATLFGDLYMLLCLSTGRWLSRKETRNLVRTLPSVYQMLPGAIQCKNNLHWLKFDPMATGVAPTGYMVAMPTVLGAHLDLMALLFSIGNPPFFQEIQTAIRTFMEGPSEGVPSARASRNTMTFINMMARAFRVQATFGAILATFNWNNPNIGEEFARFGEAGRNMQNELEALAAAFKGFFAQIQRTFIDCRNPRKLYEDIYTGIFDLPEERPLAAASLPLFYRFDEALTVSPKEERAVSLADALMRLMTFLLGGVGEGLRAFAFGFAAMFTGSRMGQTYSRWQREHREGVERARADNQALLDARREARIVPKAYIPPHTYCIYASDEPMAAGAILQPTAFISYDDSNEVTSAFVPDLVGQGHPLANRGDGVVPAPSANPDDELLSTPFVAVQEVPRGRHNTLVGDIMATRFINQKIDENLPDFVRSQG